jgi:hypothetical protein
MKNHLNLLDLFMRSFLFILLILDNFDFLGFEVIENLKISQFLFIINYRFLKFS